MNTYVSSLRLLGWTVVVSVLFIAVCTVSGGGDMICTPGNGVMCEVVR